MSAGWRHVTTLLPAPYDCRRMTTDDARTSIDWLDLLGVPGLAGATGRLGMTGHVGALRLRRGDGVDVVVSLVDDGESAAAGLPGIVDELAGEGMVVIRHPIADMGVPADRVPFGAMLDDVRDDILGGQTVVISCLGGFGRTGTAVACLLVDAGVRWDAAISLVRATRPGAIERETQEDYIRGWANRS